MTSLSGKISDRLRTIFKPGDKAYNPGRPADVTPKRGKVPPGVEGHQLGGRKRQGRNTFDRPVVNRRHPVDLWVPRDIKPQT